MDLQQRVKLAMDNAIQESNDREEEARLRKELLKYYSDEDLEGINLPGIRALFGEKIRMDYPNSQANDARGLAFDAAGKSLAERYGIARPRRL